MYNYVTGTDLIPCHMIYIVQFIPRVVVVGRGPTSAKNGRLGDITIPGFVPPVLKSRS